MQTWNSVCGAGGNPNSRKLEGTVGCATQALVRRVALRYAAPTGRCRDPVSSEPTLKGGSWEGRGLTLTLEKRLWGPRLCASGSRNCENDSNQWQAEARTSAVVGWHCDRKPCIGCGLRRRKGLARRGMGGRQRLLDPAPRPSNPRSSTPRPPAQTPGHPSASSVGIGRARPSRSRHASVVCPSTNRSSPRYRLYACSILTGPATSRRVSRRIRSS